MVEYLNELWNFGKLIYDLPRTTFVTYTQVMFDPFSFFGSWNHGWGKGYFIAGLTVSSFLFKYSIPREELSKNPVVKWLLQIPMSKLKGYVSKGGILYLSAFWFIVGTATFPFFYLLPGENVFRTHLQVLIHCLATVYLTVGLVLIVEHLIMRAVGRKSILLTWKITMIEGKATEKAMTDSLRRANEQNDDRKEKSVLQMSKDCAEIGRVVGAPFLE